MPAKIDAAIIGAGRQEHLYRAATIGRASAILATSIFHFGQISMPEAKQCLEERGIPMNVERTWLLNELGN